MNLSYAAGFVDGEGCISFTKCRGNFVPRILVTNTNLEILEEFKESFGGRIQANSRGSSIKEHWKQSYNWVITHSKAVEFASKIEKHLRIKNRQAHCLFAFNTIKVGKGNTKTQEHIEAVELLESQLRWLNKKGKHNDIEPILEFLEKGK